MATSNAATNYLERRLLHFIFKNNNIKRLVIVLHGNNRTAITRQNDIIQAANTENKYLETLIISPHFIGTQELIDNNLDDFHLL